jgi:hypothetical protein
MAFNKQAEITAMISDPKYTSDWIAASTDLLEKYPDQGVDMEYLKNSGLTAMQINIVAELVKHFNNDFLSAYEFVANNKYNDTQLQVIMKALDDGMAFDDVMSIADDSTSYAKLNWLLIGVKEGLDNFRDPIYKNYHPDQLQEIYSSWKDGVKFDDFDRVDFDARLMQVIRHARCIGLTVEISDEKKLTIY